MSAETALELAEVVKTKAVDALKGEGLVHMFDVNTVSSILTAPYFILSHLSEFTLNPLRNVRRFCQLTQASYLQKVSNRESIILFADDGDPDRARVIQIEGPSCTEFLQLNLTAGRKSKEVTDALLLCTQRNPEFGYIRPYLDWPFIISDGQRFDGKIAKIQRVATAEDLKRYLKQLELLPEMQNITCPETLSWAEKPAFATLRQ